MRSHEFKVRAEGVLHLIDDGALDSGDVRKQRSGFDKLLIISNPFEEDVRIEGKDDDVVGPDEVSCRLRCAVVYHPLLQGIVYGVLRTGDGANAIALALQGLRVAASDEAEADDEYLFVFAQHSFSNSSTVRSSGPLLSIVSSAARR